MKFTKLLFLAGTLTGLAATAAFAQDAAPAAAEAAGQGSDAAATAVAYAAEPNVAYIFNTLLFLVGGFLVMWMAAGFAMLEAGLVRSKNVSMQCLKNIALYSIAGIMYWIVGYNLMYTGVDGGYFGSFGTYSFDAVGGNNLATGYSTASDWFFQMVFVATAASIVSGTLAERIKLWPFLAFTVILTGFIYPIAGSWQWGAGWLSVMGFSDFAGSTLVHSVGGWAALAGALLLGARKGRFAADGRGVAMPGSSIPLATLGTFILWLGWFGFNGASQLAMGTISDVSDVSRIFANTNLAAAGGVVASMILLQVIYKRVDVTMVLNGALAGLVSITAEPLQPSPPVGDPDRCRRWRDRGLRRAAARQAEDRRRGRCDPGPSPRRYLGHHGRAADQCGDELHRAADRCPRLRRLHLRRQPGGLGDPQGGDGHPGQRGGRGPRPRPDRGGRGSLSGVLGRPRLIRPLRHDPRKGPLRPLFHVRNPMPKA